jgi:predicted dehydrogenase
MTLRGAISGFGEVAARGHLAGWRAVPDVQIIAVHDPIAARRHEAINLIKHIRVYDDLELMLDGEKLDFVDIASPPGFHLEAARVALEAGAHALVEKPMCLDQATWAVLHAAAQKAGRVLMCVHNWKHAPAYRRAQELIASGRLGTLTSSTLDRLRTGPAGAAGSAGSGGGRWRLDARSGGGILIDHGWHVSYLMQWLMGGERPLSVAAELGYVPSSNVDDFASLRIDFPGGGRAEARLSWRADRRATSAVFNGTEADLAIDGNRLTLTPAGGAGEGGWRSPGRRAEIEDHSVADADDDSYHPSWFAGMAAEFVNALGEGPQGPTTVANWAEIDAALGLMLAARESASRNGARVAVDRLRHMS